MHIRRLNLLPGILLLMSACATLPTGPGVLVVPHVGTPLETFQGDDRACQGYASHQLRSADVEPCIVQSTRSAKLTTASSRLVMFGEMG